MGAERGGTAAGRRRRDRRRLHADRARVGVRERRPLTRYFEDFRPGDVVQLGRRRVTRDEIVAFAREFDPQPFHLDEEGGARAPFGGLVASGWHTAAIFMGLFVRE